MSIDSRALSFQALAAFGGLLVVVFGFLLLATGLHAYGWRYGEAVEVTVPESCEYDVGTGELVDCEGIWTTADGVRHTAQIKGSVGILTTGTKTVQRRAWGDRLYAEPGRWTGNLGMSSPYAVGAGLLLLALAFAVRPGRDAWARARSEPLAAELTTLARDRDLGAERARYWARDSAVYGVFVFDDGCVVSWRGETPSLFRWDEVVAVFERAYRNRNESKTRRLYLVCLDGDEWSRFDESAFDDVLGLGTAIVESVNQRLLPTVRTALRQGQTYRFPMSETQSPIYLSPTGVGCDEVEFPWSEITGVGVENGLILIRGKQTMQCPWGNVGNPTLLFAILRSVIAGQKGQADVAR